MNHETFKWNYVFVVLASYRRHWILNKKTQYSWPLILISLKKIRKKKVPSFNRKRSTKHFMLNLIVYVYNFNKMKFTQRRYRIKCRKIHIFLHFFFLLMFSSWFTFFRGASKTTRRKTQADFDTCFCDGLLLLGGTDYWLPVSYSWYRSNWMANNANCSRNTFD